MRRELGSEDDYEDEDEVRDRLDEWREAQLDREMGWF